MSEIRCQDADKGCPACHGECRNASTLSAYRVDMQDETGTPVCEACWYDMAGAGVFIDGPVAP